MEYEQNKSKRARRKSNTFPPEFLRLLTYIADTGEVVKIEGLSPNAKSTYTTFRARVNEFRRSYQIEAKRGEPSRSMEIADRMYSVVLKDPTYDEDTGGWYMLAQPKESGFAEALQKLLPSSESSASGTQGLMQDPTEDEAAEALKNLYKD
jgi:hypothetical protein